MLKELDRYQKIQTLDALSAILQSFREENKVIVHCHGVFDLIHPGHLRYFGEAKSFGEILVVTLSPDRFVNKGPERPVFNQKLRAEALAALQVVDFVAINDTPSAVETILQLQPDIAIITSVDADHLDIYKNKEDLHVAFKQFASQIKQKGVLLVEESIAIDFSIPANIRLVNGGICLCIT